MASIVGVQRSTLTVVPAALPLILYVLASELALTSIQTKPPSYWLSVTAAPNVMLSCETPAAYVPTARPVWLAGTGDWTRKPATSATAPFRQNLKRRPSSSTRDWPKTI